MNTNVITFDGYSGTGKGTISIMLAKKIGFHYLDSGAIYSTLGIALNRENVNFRNIHQICPLPITPKRATKAMTPPKTINA